MDPVSQTLFTMALMFIATVVGKKMGRQEGINAAVSYLIEMGACTEDDLKRANERFMDGDDI
tara:strand:+ start:98 stop:283 length:186 start_codon:yes stop_codon:yes gene_type:complete